MASERAVAGRNLMILALAFVLSLAVVSLVLSRAGSPGGPAEPAAPATVDGQGQDAEGETAQPLPAERPAAVALPASMNGADREEAETRHRMVEQQLRQRGISDPRVLAAMEAVPRHLFVPASQRSAAYGDTPLAIGQGQTISQPYMVARMTELLGIGPGDKVLEIGTGSGYQSAVLAEVVGPQGQVYSMEIVAPLGIQARRTLEERGYKNVHVRIGDGYKGWPEQAPFDAIIVTAAPPEVPQPLLDQVRTGGRIVLPVGEVLQDLHVLTKLRDGTFDRQKVLPVRFVPMTGEAQRGHR